MYLYKLEFELEQNKVHLVVAAENDAEAFKYADAELEKHFVAMPEVKEAALVEKKPIRKGIGYVIE